MTEGVSPELTNTDSYSDSVFQIYDIGTMTSQMIGSVKVSLMPSRNVSETKATVQDGQQAKTFQSQGHHSTELDDLFTKTVVASKRDGLLENFTY